MSPRAVMFSIGERLDAVSVVLRQFGWEATESSVEGELLDLIGRRGAELVVIGATAGFNRTGIALTQAIRARDTRCAIVLCT